MLVVAACAMVLLLAICWQLGTKDPPLDRDDVRRVRRVADQTRRDELLPYE